MTGLVRGGGALSVAASGLVFLLIINKEQRIINNGTVGQFVDQISLRPGRIEMTNWI